MREDMQLLFNKIDSLLCSDPRVSLKEIARLLGTDRPNIERAIYECSGFSFRELRKRHLLECALKFLEQQPSRHLKEVAAAVGLTPNHLSHLIRTMTGRRATDLRRQKS